MIPSRARSRAPSSTIGVGPGPGPGFFCAGRWPGRSGSFGVQGLCNHTTMSGASTPCRGRSRPQSLCNHTTSSLAPNQRVHPDDLEPGERRADLATGRIERMTGANYLCNHTNHRRRRCSPETPALVGYLSFSFFLLFYFFFQPFYCGGPDIWVYKNKVKIKPEKAKR